ncbi:MAG: hypothetical protein KAS32_26720 [Candidatus Peribacteraceae bacterium]|nr:hypothetical protein [Candidatus Peribacteraceae bacterium]
MGLSSGDFDLRKDVKISVKCEKCGVPLGDVKDDTYQYMISTNSMKCSICNKDDEIQVDIETPIPEEKKIKQQCPDCKGTGTTVENDGEGNHHGFQSMSMVRRLRVQRPCTTCKAKGTIN